jgi:hypothetical protein
MFALTTTVLLFYFGSFVDSKSAPISPSNDLSDSPQGKQMWQWATRTGMPLETKISPCKKFIYAAMKNGGVTVLRLRNPAPPTPVANVSSRLLAGLDAVALAQNGNYLYVALGDIFGLRLAKAGLAAIDVSNPESPHVVSLWQSTQGTGGSSSLLIHNGNLYLGAMAQGIFIFSLAQPDCPKHISSFRPDPNFPIRNPNRVQLPNVRAMAADQQFLYVCYDAGGLRVLDISDTAAPKEVGRYINKTLLNQQQAYNGIVLAPPYAFLTCDYAGLEVVDVRVFSQVNSGAFSSSPLKSIQQIAWWDPWRGKAGRNFWFGSQGHANQIAMDKSTNRIFISTGDSELVVLDVSDQFHPRVTSHYGAVKDGFGAWGVTLDGGIAYLTYIRALIPFRSNFNGIKAIQCDSPDFLENIR